MLKVLVTRAVPGPAIDLLRRSSHAVHVNPHERLFTRTELLEAVGGCSGVLAQLADRVDAEFFDAAGSPLKVVSNFAVGYNNIDIAEARRRGVRICNTPGVLTEATADIAWTLILGTARRVSEGEKIIRSGSAWNFSPTTLLGGDLVGKVLAIVGAGRIGHAVARRAMGWNMKVLYAARSRHEDFERDFGAEQVELDEAMRRADVVSVHTPLSEETRHLINARRIALMKPTAYLINTSRGPVVDEQALVAALQAGTLAGAGLDVYENEPELAAGLAECENTLLLPHLGSATIHTRSEMGRLAAENLLAVLDGRAPAHAVV